MNLRLPIPGTLAAVLLAAGCATAAEPQADPFRRLSALVQAAVPDAVITTNGNTLTASFQTMTFKIHGRAMTGQIEKEAHDAVGPMHTGFQLHAHLQPEGEVNQAVTPQTLREPYWLTDLEVTPVAGSGRQIYSALSYGSRMDTNTLAKLRAAVQSLKDAP